MIRLAPLLLALLPPGSGPATTWCDKIELNHKWTCGQKATLWTQEVEPHVSFTQVILWRWSPQYSKYEVIAWVLFCEHKHKRPTREDGVWVFICWRECRQRIVKARHFVETHTYHDPEIDERAWLPTGERVGLN